MENVLYDICDGDIIEKVRRQARGEVSELAMYAAERQLEGIEWPLDSSGENYPCVHVVAERRTECDLYLACRGYCRNTDTEVGKTVEVSVREICKDAGLSSDKILSFILFTTEAKPALATEEK